MKNIFKKISISILAVFAAMFALGEAPLAYAASFNNDPLDYQTLRVGNSTQNPSYTSANWGTSVNANAGDILNFAIYYHNTSNETATNVRVTLAPQNSGTGTTQTFTATLTAGNVPTLTATATVYLSSSQSINYDPGFVTWRPNQTTYGSQTLLNSQTGAEIFSTGGLYLGDVGPGWSTQGSVVVAFRVSGTPSSTTTVPPVTTSYTTTSSAPNYPIVYTYLPEAVGDGYAILKGYASPNGTPDVTRWFEWGTAQYSLTNQTIKTNQGNSVQDFSQTISSLTPSTTYYYRAVAQNSYGTSYGTVLSFSSSSYGTSYGSTGTPSGFTDSPIVVTNLPERISDTSMKLSGTVLPRGYVSTSGWFDWGATPALGNKTQSTNLGPALSIDFSDTLYGLTPNTLYYYQAVGQNQNGIARGSVLTFRPNKTTPPASVSAPSEPSAPVAKTPGKITLTITTDSEELIPTQINGYKINYKNSGGDKIYDATLRVILPAGIDYETSKSDFQTDKNILTLELGDISAKEEGAIRFDASVNKNTKNKDVLVTTAIMTYRTAKDGDLEASDDSVSNTIISDPRRTTGNGLAALSFFGGGDFLPNTLIEWVVFTLSTMGIIYFSKRFYGLYNAKKNYKRRADDDGEEEPRR